MDLKTLFSIGTKDENFWSILAKDFGLEEVNPVGDLSEDEITFGWAWDMAYLDYKEKGITFFLDGQVEDINTKPKKVPDYYTLRRIDFYVAIQEDYHPYKGNLPLGLSVNDTAQVIINKLGAPYKQIKSESDKIKALEYLNYDIKYRIYFTQKETLRTISVELNAESS